MKIGIIAAFLSTAAALQVSTVYRYVDPTSSAIRYGNYCPNVCIYNGGGTSNYAGSLPIIGVPAGQNNAQGSGASTGGLANGLSNGASNGLSTGANSGGNAGGGTSQAQDGQSSGNNGALVNGVTVQTTVIVLSGTTVTTVITTVPTATASASTFNPLTTPTRLAFSASSLSFSEQSSSSETQSKGSNGAVSDSLATSGSSSFFSAVASSTSAAASATPTTTVLYNNDDPSQVMVAGPAIDGTMELFFDDLSTATPAQFYLAPDGSATEATSGYQLIAAPSNQEVKRNIFSSSKKLRLQKTGTFLPAQILRIVVEDSIINFFMGALTSLTELCFDPRSLETGLFIGDPGLAALLDYEVLHMGALPYALLAKLAQPSSVPSTTAVQNPSSTAVSSSSSSAGSASATPSVVSVPTNVYLKVDGSEPAIYIGHQRKPVSTPEQFQIASTKVLFQLLPDGTMRDFSSNWIVDATYDPTYNNGFRYSVAKYLQIDVMTPVRYTLLGRQISFKFGPTERAAQLQYDANNLLYISDQGQSWPGESVITVSIEPEVDASVSTSSVPTAAPTTMTFSTRTSSSIPTPTIPALCPNGYVAGSYLHGSAAKYSIQCGTSVISGSSISSAMALDLGSCMTSCEASSLCTGVSYVEASGQCTLYSGTPYTQVSSTDTVALITARAAACPSGYSNGHFTFDSTGYSALCGTTVTGGTFLASTDYTNIGDCIRWFSTWGGAAAVLNFDTTGPSQSCTLYAKYGGTAFSSTATVVFRDGA